MGQPLSQAAHSPSRLVGSRLPPTRYQCPVQGRLLEGLQLYMAVCWPSNLVDSWHPRTMDQYHDPRDPHEYTRQHPTSCGTGAEDRRNHWEQ